MARPSKKVPEREVAILEALRGGKSRTAAAAMVDVHYATIHRWCADDVAFREAVEKAEAFAQGRYESIIFAAATESWQAAAWWLERRHSQEYGRKDRVDVRLDVKAEAARLAEDLGLDADSVLAEAVAILGGA